MQSLVTGKVNISESMSSYIIASFIHSRLEIDVKFEHYLKHIQTGQYSIADVYIPPKSTAIEVKSLAHGNSALKGVIQASIYKEQCDNSMFFMQKPRRNELANGITNFAEDHGVGVIFLENAPKICSKELVSKATGGCPDPFRVWQRDRFSTTRTNIIANSKNDQINEYIAVIDKIIENNYQEMFEFAVKPQSSKQGFSSKYI